MLLAGKLPKLKKMAKSGGECWKSCQNFVQDFVQPIFLKFPTWVGCCPTFVKKQGGCGIALMQIQHFFGGTILHLLHLDAQNIVFWGIDSPENVYRQMFTRCLQTNVFRTFVGKLPITATFISIVGRFLLNKSHKTFNGREKIKIEYGGEEKKIFSVENLKFSNL